MLMSFNIFSSASASSSVTSSETLEQYVMNIVRNPTIRSQAEHLGLAVQSVSWEDNARYNQSSVGPCISDMTLAIPKSREKRDATDLYNWNPLPMIRYPNFADKTADVPINNFQITVGNETDEGSLKRIPLKEYLQNIGQYVKTTDGVPTKSLYCLEKDENILTSAQFCLLPLASGTTEFNVRIYNYQNRSDDPAVLVLVCSQKGTSAQTLANNSTSLFFNTAGKAANYVAERMKDERKRLGKAIEGKMSTDEAERNVLMIFQIPLKQKLRQHFVSSYGNGVKSLSSVTIVPQCEIMECCSESLSSFTPKSRSFTTASVFTSTRESISRGLDRAMLSISKTHSTFEGIKNNILERDTRFPIRCTFQYYGCTDSQNINNEMWTEIKTDIDKIYNRNVSVATGSLVTETNNRTTAWDPNNNHESSEFTKTLPSNEANKAMFLSLV
jgi:hypothetical protein